MKNQFLNTKSDFIKTKRLKKRIDRVIVDFNKEIETIYNLSKEEIKVRKKQDDEKLISKIRKSLEI